MSKTNNFDSDKSHKFWKFCGQQGLIQLSSIFSDISLPEAEFIVVFCQIKQLMITQIISK